MTVRRELHSTVYPRRECDIANFLQSTDSLDSIVLLIYDTFVFGALGISLLPPEAPPW